MALKNSEMISLRTTLGKDVVAGLDTYLEEAAGGYGSYLSPALQEGEVLFDTRQQVVLLRRRVNQEVKNLEALNQGVTGQMSDTDSIRFLISRAASAADAKLRYVRHMCKGAYGVHSLALTGLKGVFPRAAKKLYERGVLVKSSLMNPDLGLEPVVLFIDENGEPKDVSPADLARGLDPELTELGRLVDSRFVGNRGIEDVRALRRLGIDTFDHNIRAILRMLQGMFRLAGRDDLAARFRPILQRVGRGSGEPSEPTEPVSEPTDSPTDSTSTP